MQEFKDRYDFALLAMETKYAAENKLFSDAVGGHMDRVKLVAQMIERDLRAEIETQRDRITVLNKRVQDLEGRSHET